MPQCQTDRIQLGTICGAHGIRGTLTVHSECRPPHQIGDYPQWLIGTDSDHCQPFDLNRCWQHGKNLLATLAQVGDRNQALALRGNKIFISRAQIAASHGDEHDNEEHLWHDLIGCQAFERAQGKLLGAITRLESYGAADILIINSDQGEWMLPFTDAVVDTVDTASSKVWITLPEGMDACFTPKS
ncbi:MAG: ribosome maturation factor RimM [Mariprofundales bacterium]